MRKRILNEVEKRKEKITSLSQFLYHNPEIGWEEHLAAKKIVGILREEGFQVTENLGGLTTAFRGSKKNGSGPRIAFIAEYDVLPEIGHACGHHLITAMSVGAALSLSVLLDTYPGEIILIGTPAEESGAGKIHLIDQGIFSEIDAAMMIHPHHKTCLSPVMLALAGLEFTFFGKTAHAAAVPHLGINALDAVILLFNNINAHRQQLKDDVRIHGIIVEGGEAPNIIPSKCRVRIEIRAEELGKPVKIELNRKECIISTRTRTKVIGFVKTAVDRSGKILARDFRVIADTGAYTSNGAAIASAMGKKLFRQYRIEHQGYKGMAVHTNSAVAGAARGYGTPQITAISEINMESTAKKIGMDPLEFRLKNLVHPFDPDLSGGPSLGDARALSSIW